ncbi:AAA family ATPase [Exiguobacterium sp. S22-S28]|uniref:AAA family ATPase n=1 Tax=Exiguobacterium sp. S22-S28 TaxID=3342768 RepID=UPI00372D48BE
MTIKLDLSKQEYNVFNIADGQFLEISNKNFIFGKNGAGKSTLRKMIMSQLIDKYDVRIFTGFNNLIVDEKLNAVVLGKENIKSKDELDEIEEKLLEYETQKNVLQNEVKSLLWKQLYIEEGIQKNPLYVQYENLLREHETQKNKVDTFYTDKAREIRSLDSPQIVKLSYMKNSFAKDIKNSKILSDSEVSASKQILMEIVKSNLKMKFNPKNIDFNKLILNVNEILENKIKEVNLMKELKSDPNRMTFAKNGLTIHKAGEYCSFCGGEVTKERIQELEIFVSLSDIKEIEVRLDKMLKEVDELYIQVEEIETIKKEDYYNFLHDEVHGINNEIEMKKKEYINLLNTIKNSLVEKSNDTFKSVQKLNTVIPSDFETISNNIKSTIKKHNHFTDNVIFTKEKTKEKLRLHYVALKLLQEKDYMNGWRGYTIEHHELIKYEKDSECIKNKIDKKVIDIIGTKKNIKENTILYLENEIEKKINSKNEILKNTKNTLKLVEIINSKLKKSGKQNLELALVKDSNNIEHYQIKNQGAIRAIDKLSTGEKNIIAFLYFIESLSDVEKKNNKKKVVVFDDPMNSNDDNMQYLIITEIQKIYNSQYPEKFNSVKDYFICLTHNAHFYLNVQPHGHRVEKKIIDGKEVEISKYDKNKFYRLENGVFNHIDSFKKDFSTHYEFLWLELKDLYLHNLVNSMLNSMRRIIETYIKFNKKNLMKFYKNYEEHKKLFDVNSHSIDDYSIEMIGKDKDSLISMFRELFVANDALEHFETYWK